ncbi:MAG: hypothetical protein J5755_01495, partial [Clostridia bacterium]|nr:hypothetical protein [Clostridia bacterium]
MNKTSQINIKTCVLVTVITALVLLAAAMVGIVCAETPVEVARADGHVHNFSYSYKTVGNYNKLVATCDNADGLCGLTNCQASCYIGQAKSYTYDGEACPLYMNKEEFDAAGITFDDAYVLIYTGESLGGDSYGPTSDAPINAGTYTVSVSVAIAGDDYELTRTYTVKPKTISFANHLSDATFNTYTGFEQNILKAEPTGDGPSVPQYSISTNNQNWGDWSTDQPRATDCTTLFVRCKMVPTDPNYAESDYETRQIRLGQYRLTAEPTYYVDGVETTGYKPAGVSDLRYYYVTYDGQAHTLEAKTDGINGDVVCLYTSKLTTVGRDLKNLQYTLNANSFAAEGATVQNYFYYPSDFDRMCFEIQKADYDMSGVVYENVKQFNGEEQYLSISNLPVGADGTRPTPSKSGMGATYPSDGVKTWSVAYTTMSSNYNAPAAVTVDFEIVPREVAVTLSEVGCYDATTKTVSATYFDVAGEEQNATVTYAVDADRLNAGDFDLTIEIEDGNYELIEASGYTVSAGVGSATITIAPRPTVVTVRGDLIWTYDGNTHMPDLCYLDPNNTVCTPSSNMSWTAQAGAYAVTFTLGDNYELQDGDFYTHVGNTGSFIYFINPKPLTCTIEALDKVYDGNINATLDITLEGVLDKDKDNVSFAYGAYFFDKNADESKSVTLGFLELEGTASGNYCVDLNELNLSAAISPRPITVTAEDKAVTYGDPQAQLTYTMEGTLAEGDNAADVFFLLLEDDASAGEHEITVELWGNDNYDVTCVGATYTINPKALTISGILAIDKEYDGTTQADLDMDGMVLSGLLDQDDVEVYATGVFDDPNVGLGKTVSIEDYELGGLASDNYTISGSSQASATADIVTATITVSGIKGVDRDYDGTTQASFDYSEVVLDGYIAGDDLSVVAQGAFGDKNVGEGKTITITSLTLQGDDAGNYELDVDNSQNAAQASITPKAVYVSGIAAKSSKTYDGTTAIGKTCFNTNNVVYDGKAAGDTLSVDFSGVLEDKNAGEGKTATLVNLTLTGADAGNYYLPDEGQQTTVTGFTVSKRYLGASCEGFKSGYGTKEYNGTTQYVVYAYELKELN